MAIATLTIDIQAKLANIERDLGRVAQQSEATAKRMEEAFGKAAAGMTAVREAAVAAVSAMATGAFAAWVQHAIDGADAFNDLAERTGIAASNLSAYAYAAKLSGTDIEGLGAGLKAFSKSVTEGNEAFKAMGVSTKDAAGHLRGTDQILEDVADKFSGYADGAAKSALAMQLFGKAGVELIPFLDNGKQGLADLRQEAESLGAVLDERTIKAAGDFNDNLDRLRAASSGYAAKLFGELSPALATVTDSMLGTAKQSGDLQIIIDGLAVSIKGLITAGYGVGAVFDQIGTSLGAVSAAAVQALQGNFKQAGDILDQNGADFNTRSEAWASKIADVWAKVPQKTSDAVDEAAKNADKGAAPTINDTAKKAEEAAARLGEAYAQLVKSLQTKLVEQQQGTELDKLEIDLAQKKLAGLSNYQREVLRSYARQIDLQKLLRIEADATAKSVQEAGKRQADTLKGLQDDLDRATRELQTYGKTRSEIADMDVAALQQQVDEEARLNAEIGVAGSGYLDYLRQQLQLRQQIANVSHGLDTADAAKKTADAASAAAKETQQRWQKTVDDIDEIFREGFRASLDGNADAWKSWCDNLEKTFKTAVADQIYKLFAEPIVVQLVGSLSGLAGVANAVGGASAGKAGAAANGSNAFATGLNVLSNVKTAYGLYTQGLAGTLGSGIGTLGSWVGSQYLTGMGAGLQYGAMGAGHMAALADAGIVSSSAASGASAGAAGSAGIAAWSGPAMAIVAGILANIDAYNSGFRYERNDSNAVFGDKKQFAGRFADWLDNITPGFLNSSEFAHKLVSNVIGDTNNLFAKITGSNKMAAVLSGSALHEKLFGHGATNADAGGLSGTIDLSGLTGQMWQDFSQRGGWFRSDNRWTEKASVAPDLQNIIDATVKSSVAGVKAIGAQLGIAGEDALKGFQHAFSLQLTGENGWDDALNRIQGELGKVSDELATRLVPTIADFGQYGESASQTLSRLSQEISATDVILEAMGKTSATAFGAVGLASVKAREDLIALAGGLDALTAKTQYFYQNYYADDERIGRAAESARRQLEQIFAGMGLALPASKAAFRALVEGQDLSTEAGRKLFAQLIDLSDEFDVMSKASDSLADAAKKAADAIKAAADSARGQQVSLFDKFASPDLKLAKARADIEYTFGRLGEAIPATATEFLRLALSLDPATQRGRDMVSMLSGVGDAFDLVAKTASDAAAKARDAWQSAADALASARTGIRNTALDALSPESRYNQLRSQFVGLSTQHTSDAAAQLAGLADKLAQSSRDYFGSGAGYQADLGMIDQALSSNIDYAKSQVTLQDTIAKAAQAAVDQLILVNAQLAGRGASPTNDPNYNTSADLWDRIPNLVDRWRNWFRGEANLLPKYATGTAFVAGDQIAQIHHGEAVVDAQSMQVLRRYGIPAGSGQDQSAMIAELRASREVLTGGFAGMQQQLASANARLAAVEKRLAAVEDQSRLSRAGMGI